MAESKTALRGIVSECICWSTLCLDAPHWLKYHVIKLIRRGFKRKLTLSLYSAHNIWDSYMTNMPCWKSNFIGCLKFVGQNLCDDLHNNLQLNYFSLAQKCCISVPCMFSRLYFVTSVMWLGGLKSDIFASHQIYTPLLCFDRLTLLSLMKEFPNLKRLISSLLWI